MEEDLVLVHHGINGQKKGVRNGPPYPLSRAVSTGKSLKKKVSADSGSTIAKYKAHLAKKSQVKTAKEAEKKKAEEERLKEKNEKTKAKVLKSRSVSQLYKHADLFSNQELRDLKDRYTIESDIKKLKNSESTQKGKNFIDKVATAGDMASKVANLVDNGSKAYNNVAKVLNSIYDSDIPIIGDKKNGKKEVEYSTVTRTKDQKGNDVTITKKWKE